MITSLFHLLLAVIITAPLYAGEKTVFFHKRTPRYYVAPKTSEELQVVVNKAYKRKKKIALAGSQTTLAHQTSAPDCLMLDMTHLNKVVSFDKKQQRVTVQAGMTWRALIEFLSMHRCSVMSMPVYSDCTIGGSLACDTHGHMVQSSLVSSSVRHIKVMRADGTFIDADRANNVDLFNAVLGGYGLCGIIVEATLDVTPDCLLIQQSSVMPASVYPGFFEGEILGSEDVHFHEARLSLDPKALFEDVMSITLRTTYDGFDAEDFQLAKGSTFAHRVITEVVRRVPWLKRHRFGIEAWISNRRGSMSRNNYLYAPSFEQLQPLDASVSVVQSLYVPVDRYEEFLKKLKSMVIEQKIPVANVSITYVKSQDQTMLTYAPQEMFAFVISLYTANTRDNYYVVERWIRSFIDAALLLEGTFGLSYYSFATRKQFEKAYPRATLFAEVKKTYDPQTIFVNDLVEKYRLA